MCVTVALDKGMRTSKVGAVGSTMGWDRWVVCEKVVRELKLYFILFAGKPSNWGIFASRLAGTFSCSLLHSFAERSYLPFTLGFCA